MSDARRSLSLSPGFAAQFTPDGDGYIYRKAWTGAAFSVSGAERDAFVSAFSRSLALQILGVTAGLLGVVSLPLIFAFARGPFTVVWVVVGATALTAVMVLAFLAAWGAPALALAGRTAISPPLTGIEARRVRWARTGWAQIGFSGFWALFLASRGLERSPRVAPWIWFSLAAVLLLASANLAFRKLRIPKAAGPTSPSS